MFETELKFTSLTWPQRTLGERVAHFNLLRETMGWPFDYLIARSRAEAAQEALDDAQVSFLLPMMRAVSNPATRHHLYAKHPGFEKTLSLMLFLKYLDNLLIAQN